MKKDDRIDNYKEDIDDIPKPCATCVGRRYHAECNRCRPCKHYDKKNDWQISNIKFNHHNGE